MEKQPEHRSPRDVFAWRVWELVFKRDMKLTELAEKAGVPYKRLHAYVRMGQEPPLEVVVKVADALGVSVDYLLGRVDQTNQLLPEEEKFAADVKFIRRAYKEMSEKERKALYRLAETLWEEASREEKNGKRED